MADRRVWTECETTRKLHLAGTRREMRCGYMPPLWTQTHAVIDPPESACCKRCLASVQRGESRG